MPIELKGRIHSSKQQSARLPNKVVIQRRLIFGRPDSGGANIDKVNTLCNGPEFDMACKLKREPAMWLWHWCYDYRGYDVSTLEKLFKGFQLDAALLGVF